jgi:diguanylate cyclase
MLVVAATNTAQLLVLPACVTLASMQVSQSNSSLATGILITAVAAFVLWLITTIVGIFEFNRQCQSKNDIDELLGMTEALQSAETNEDTATVLMATSLQLMPKLGGALYVFNNSRDRLDLTRSWNLGAGHELPDHISSSNCWALKRGKVQINRATSTKLRCLHHTGSCAKLEVPMVARGAVYGLLIFTANDEPDVGRTFQAALGYAQAMADAMSLALSNIDLREKLRTQSLRDPLTGLFNRRYMEDALERYVGLAERSGSSTSLLMLDLDNFKRLNDEHGHAKGDAVLRDVAAQIVGVLRSSGVVCRYGGEEIVAILPDCTVEEAFQKAQGICTRISQLSDVHAAVISASIGVSCIPHIATTAVGLLATADSALYRAKAAGKNCVVIAKDDGGSSAKKIQLAVTS